MVKSGILNPRINSLFSLVRHTNTLVIADRGFPFWKEVETVDISLADDIPRVLDVLAAIRGNFSVARAFMAEEFNQVNGPETILAIQARPEWHCSRIRTSQTAQETSATCHRDHSDR